VKISKELPNRLFIDAQMDGQNWKCRLFNAHF